jgi:hypothetical protein
MDVPQRRKRIFRVLSKAASAFLRLGRRAPSTRFGYSAGDVNRIAMELIDHQDKIETASYDPETGRQAVFAARRLVTDLPLADSGEKQLKAILHVLGALRLRQHANIGEYSSGAATIGSIIAALKTSLRP